MRLVIDTNVLLSALFPSASPSAQILAPWRSRRFELLTSAEQIDEIARVTRYPRIRARRAPALAGRLVNRLRDVAIVVEKLPKVDRSPDPDDNYLYLLALAEGGQASLSRYRRQPVACPEAPQIHRIVTPAALLKLLKNQGTK